MKYVRVCAVLALVGATAAHAQVTFTPGGGGFQDITGMSGTLVLPIGLGGFHVQTTAIGNDKFPAGDIKIGYNGTIGSNVGAAISTSNHQPIPTNELFLGETAIAVIWDTPDPALGSTQVLFREFTDDPNDTYYIVQWNDLPMGGAGGKATFQTRVNGNNPFRTTFYAQLSYQSVHEPGIFGGAFATIGYQSHEPGVDSVQWSFDQPFAVQNGMDLFLVDVPSPGTGLMILAGSLGVLRRRR
ncbi:MAG: hypothetical protein HBSAPP03_29540 [Phycisphaerae bacterium]|nr:MAG: hypothetical protein HBSAPP03_29540 [Phycisphaerae bacterium]